MVGHGDGSCEGGSDGGRDSDGHDGHGGGKGGTCSEGGGTWGQTAVAKQMAASAA